MFGLKKIKKLCCGLLFLGCRILHMGPQYPQRVIHIWYGQPFSDHKVNKKNTFLIFYVPFIVLLTIQLVFGVKH